MHRDRHRRRSARARSAVSPSLTPHDQRDLSPEIDVVRRLPSAAPLDPVLLLLQRLDRPGQVGHLRHRDPLRRSALAFTPPGPPTLSCSGNTTDSPETPPPPRRIARNSAVVIPSRISTNVVVSSAIHRRSLRNPHPRHPHDAVVHAMPGELAIARIIGSPTHAQSSPRQWLLSCCRLAGEPMKRMRSFLRTDRSITGLRPS